jgi:hypothetical protein
MDLEAKKIRFLREVLRLNNDKIIDKLEKVLHQERKKTSDTEGREMSIEEFNSLIDKAEDDSKNERLYNAGNILKDIDEWK